MSNFQWSGWNQWAHFIRYISYPFSVLSVFFLHAVTSRFWNTANRVTFGQIFTIFMNIFKMMNSIHVFIWGLVSTTVRETHIIILNSSWFLHFEIFTVQPCSKSPRSLGWLWTPTHIWFSKVILLQGFKLIMSLTYILYVFWTRYTSKLTDFSVFQRNTWKTYMTTCYTSKL